MKTNLILLFVLCTAALAYTYYTDHRSDAPVPTPGNGVMVGSPAPGFSFTDLTGKKHELADFRGKAVIVNFWATWCAPCVIEFPQMLDIAKKRPDTVILFLSQDETREEVDRFLKKHAFSLPQDNVFVAMDPNKKTAKELYLTYKLPESYLIDQNGVLRGKIIGAVDWTAPDIKKKIEALLR